MSYFCYVAVVASNTHSPVIRWGFLLGVFRFPAIALCDGGFFIWGGCEMAGGQPTKYKPEYCERVIEYGRMGKSITWMAAELNVSRSTIHNWTAENPEFLDALTRATAQAQKWWEDRGQDSLDSKEFNSSVWAKSMAARFPEDWRDNSKVELAGDVKHAHTIKVVFDGDDL